MLWYTIIIQYYTKSYLIIFTVSLYANTVKDFKV